MRRRSFLALPILLLSLPAWGDEEAKKKKPETKPAPKPNNPGKPKKGDGVADAQPRR